jgi:hypothetical protein
MRDDFAIFIMVYGRPEKMWTSRFLRNGGYTGKIFFVGDNTDKTIDSYKEKYKDALLVFDKLEAAKRCDSGDNSGDLRSTLYAANTIPLLAKERGIKYFMIMCDDYSHAFQYRFGTNYEYKYKSISNLDGVINAMIAFYESTPALTIAMAQGGDFIGGINGTHARPELLRKAMNTFLCSTDRPIKFIGRLNEDVTTYVYRGNRGSLFFTITNIAAIQQETQQEKGGLSDAYLDSGTYVKSFYSAMYNPSCVRVAMMGAKNKRIHHRVLWNNAVPRIIPESLRKPD